MLHVCCKMLQSAMTATQLHMLLITLSKKTSMSSNSFEGMEWEVGGGEQEDKPESSAHDSCSWNICIMISITKNKISGKIHL